MATKRRRAHNVVAARRKQLLPSDPSGRRDWSGPVGPGVHSDAVRLRKEGEMPEVAMTITLLVALLVIDRLVDRQR
jgi:hypothetical protein